jgi:hypothetical protein
MQTPGLRTVYWRKIKRKFLPDSTSILSPRYVYCDIALSHLYFWFVYILWSAPGKSRFYMQWLDALAESRKGGRNCIHFEVIHV